MDQKTARVCTAFISKVPHQKQERLMAHLSVADEEMIKSLKSEPLEITNGLAPADVQWGKIHISWIKKSLDKFSPDERPLIASVLPENVFSKVVFEKRISLSKHALEYFSVQLIESLLELEGNLVPDEMVPLSPYRQLLALQPAKMETLVSLLGLHDLSKDLSALLQAEKIRQIMDALSGDQKNYLNSLRNGFERVHFPAIPLHSWDGSSDMLQSWIQRRGMNRLAKLISEESAELKTRVTLMLPAEHARNFAELMTPLKDYGFVSSLKRQITSLIEKIADENRRVMP